MKLIDLLYNAGLESWPSDYAGGKFSDFIERGDKDEIL